MYASVIEIRNSPSVYCIYSFCCEAHPFRPSRRGASPKRARSPESVYYLLDGAATQTQDEEREGDTPGEVLQRVREILSRRPLQEKGVHQEEVPELRQALLDPEAREAAVRRLDVLALHFYWHAAHREEARLH